MLKNRSSTVYLSALVKRGGAARIKAAQDEVTADALQKVARRMAPFYRSVAISERFAARWSDAVVKLDLDRMLRLLKVASPHIGRCFPGTNSIGYFVGFAFPSPVDTYATGTTIPPGTAQSVFEPKAHREVAKAVLPLYRTLAANRSFASKLACAIQEEDAETAARMVRGLVKAKSLKSVSVESSGIALRFRFDFTKHTYRNLLFRDVAEGEDSKE